MVPGRRGSFRPRPPLVSARHYGTRSAGLAQSFIAPSLAGGPAGLCTCSVFSLALSSLGQEVAKTGVGVSQGRRTRKRTAHSPAGEDLEVRPALSESRLSLSPVGFYVEEWTKPTEGVRYAVPRAVEADGLQALERWLIEARKHRSGEVIRRKKPEWSGEEKSLVPLTPEFRKLVREVVRRSGGLHGAERAVEATIKHLPSGRHRARYRVTRKQFERIVGKAQLRCAEWRTVDAIARVGPQLGVGSPEEWQAAIQSPYVGLALGLYRSWCMCEAPGQITLDLPASALGLMRRYSRRWLRAGHERLRVSLAVYRTLEPLLVAFCAGRGIEASVAELRAGGPFRLTDFVRHGLERENILIRAQQGTARDRAVGYYARPTGEFWWREAVRATRRDVKQGMEDFQGFLEYLDFVVRANKRTA